ncbi:MAG: DUF4398 domain-containing protein, partial [Bdellovibrionaceae bacterium]|nr:DUF4398 domain-containing protein [Pseudobdellovibrionaceae bacterium]
MLYRCLLLVVFLTLTACKSFPPPNEEYAFAEAAVEAARSVEAGRHSPGNWQQAQEALRRAKILYQSGNYEKAREEFVRARLAAEKA